MNWDWDCEGGWSGSQGGVHVFIHVKRDGLFYVAIDYEDAEHAFPTFSQAEEYALKNLPT